MYSKKILNEFLEPKNYGVIRGASGVGKIVSEVGNEIIKIYIKVEGNKVTEAQFQTYGGVVAIALTSFATAWVQGRTIDELEKFNANELVKLSGDVPEEKAYLVNAVVSAVKKAANSFKNKSVNDD